MKNILFIFGTRPEAIKVAPVIREFQKHTDFFHVSICTTSQHKEILDQVLSLFSIQPDYDINLMKIDQSLFDITSNGIRELGKMLSLNKSPDFVVVQGDTSTAFIGALSAYYRRIPIVHIEAGLRSGDKYAPFPEEINRILISRLADFHFAPTKEAAKNLLKEGVKKNVWVVGNTIVDALLEARLIIKSKNLLTSITPFNEIDFRKRIILVTGHRRENFGNSLENICFALKNIALEFNDVEIVYSVHPNPHVFGPVHKFLGGVKNIHLVNPLGYADFIWLLEKSYFVVTDSGGVQEEAPVFGKPVLVTRTTTERKEGIVAGVAKLVGGDADVIIREAKKLLVDEGVYKKMANLMSLYGDGTASKKIFDILNTHFT